MAMSSFWNFLLGGGDDNNQQQQQQQQKPPETPGVNTAPRSMGWRDASDSIPLPGTFTKVPRRVLLDEDAVRRKQQQQEDQARRLHQRNAQTQQRRAASNAASASAPPCRCGFNIEAFIGCRGGFGHSRHGLASSSANSNNNANALKQPLDTMHAHQHQQHTAWATPAPYEKLRAQIHETGLLSPMIPACRVHEIRDALPVRYHDVQWRVLFASDVDGFSIGSMYRHIEASGASTGACLLLLEVAEVIRTPHQEQPDAGPVSVVGAFLTHLPTMNHGPRHFFGGPECFVFTFDDDHDDDDAEHDDDRARHNSSSHRRRRRGMLRTHRWSEGGHHPEHFIVCSASAFGIGGGEDGAALYFHGDLQRGTSSANCNSFSNSPELVGKPRFGLRQSEFRVHRMFLFSLDDSDFVDYPSLVDEAQFHATFLKASSGSSNAGSTVGGARSVSPASKAMQQRMLQQAEQQAAHNKFECRGCKIEPRPHHSCSFLAK